MAFKLKGGGTYSGTGAELEANIAGARGPIVQSWSYYHTDHLGARLADITTAILSGLEGGSAPTVDLDPDRAIVRAGQLSANPDLLPDSFDVADDHILIIEERIIVTDTVVEIVEFPLGLYHVDISETSSFETKNIVNMELSDLYIHLLTETTEVPYIIPASTDYMSAIKEILDLLGLDSSLPAPGKLTAVSHSWAPGVTYSTIVNDLTDGINYYPIWPDSSGVFIAKERISPATEVLVITYQDGVEPKLIEGSAAFVVGQNRTKSANKVVVLIDDPRHANFGFVLRENADGSSAVSTSKRPVIFKEIHSDTRPSTKTILDVPTAIAIAEFELRSIAGRSILGKITTLPDPRRGAHEFVLVDIENVTPASPWASLGFTYKLSLGQSMTHNLYKAVEIRIV